MREDSSAYKIIRMETAQAGLGFIYQEDIHRSSQAMFAAISDFSSE
jgi:hypothetical protein